MKWFGTMGQVSGIGPKENTKLFFITYFVLYKILYHKKLNMLQRLCSFSNPEYLDI